MNWIQPPRRKGVGRIERLKEKDFFEKQRIANRRYIKPEDRGRNETSNGLQSPVGISRDIIAMELVKKQSAREFTDGRPFNFVNLDGPRPRYPKYNVPSLKNMVAAKQRSDGHKFARSQVPDYPKLPENLSRCYFASQPSTEAQVATSTAAWSQGSGYPNSSRRCVVSRKNCLIGDAIRELSLPPLKSHQNVSIRRPVNLSIDCEKSTPSTPLNSVFGPPGKQMVLLSACMQTDPSWESPLADVGLQYNNVSSDASDSCSTCSSCPSPLSPGPLQVVVRLTEPFPRLSEDSELTTPIEIDHSSCYYEELGKEMEELAGMHSGTYVSPQKRNRCLDDDSWLSSDDEEVLESNRIKLQQAESMGTAAPLPSTQSILQEKQLSDFKIPRNLPPRRQHQPHDPSPIFYACAKPPSLIASKSKGPPKIPPPRSSDHGLQPNHVVPPQQHPPVDPSPIFYAKRPLLMEHKLREIVTPRSQCPRMQQAETPSSQATTAHGIPRHVSAELPCSLIGQWRYLADIAPPSSAGLARHFLSQKMKEAAKNDSTLKPSGSKAFAECTITDCASDVVF